MASTGQEDAARRLVSAGPADAWAQLARGAEPWSGVDEAERIALLGAVMAAPGAPRRAGRAAVALAQIEAAGGRGEAARGAWARALELDPFNAEALQWTAAQRLLGGDAAAAAQLMERCLRAQPAAPGCRRGRVQALIGLGQHERARAEIAAWPAGPDPALMATWARSAARPGRPLVDEAAAAAAGAPARDPLRSPALAAWIGAGAAADARARARELLSASPVLFDQVLAAAAP
jgi:predicted Zn-dependent protease